MGTFSDKIKIAYLTLVIFFAMGVFFYLLDSWGIIKLEEHIPMLSRTPPVVSDTDDSPTEIELERLRKEESRLKDEEIRLKEEASKLEGEKGTLEKRLEEIEQLRKGLDAEKQKIAERKAADADRAKMIKDMAGRIGAMPPADAVGIVAGWSNPDLVDVFIQMEKDAAESGQASIVPYLLTKLPRERASVITTLMMDEEARRLPKP